MDHDRVAPQIYHLILSRPVNFGRIMSSSSQAMAETVITIPTTSDKLSGKSAKGKSSRHHANTKVTTAPVKRPFLIRAGLYVRRRISLVSLFLGAFLFFSINVVAGSHWEPG